MHLCSSRVVCREGIIQPSTCHFQPPFAEIYSLATLYSSWNFRAKDYFLQILKTHPATFHGKPDSPLHTLLCSHFFRKRMPLAKWCFQWELWWKTNHTFGKHLLRNVVLVHLESSKNENIHLEKVRSLVFGEFSQRKSTWDHTKSA
jgi:hypothetical protein